MHVAVSPRSHAHPSRLQARQHCSVQSLLLLSTLILVSLYKPVSLFIINIYKQKWKGDRAALTYDTREHRPARGWVSLRHIEMKLNENEYFGQITVAFLSS